MLLSTLAIAIGMIQMPLPLLQTKLYLPPARPNHVQRSRLIERLNAGGARPFTLVSAPAGFGKTTVLSEWITQTDHAVAWLSLDDDDNDPTRFLTYLITALQTRQPTLGETILPLLSAPQAPAPKAILTLLLNELATRSSPLTLVLDDYHAITATPIHEAVTFFIDHLPPSIHLVISTRIDPPLLLTRWRVRNQLVEIRVDDLRFDAEEAVTFLNKVMGLRLTQDNINTLETRTEGWIAGLQLAALSLQGKTDVAGFVADFSGSNRFIVDYLIDEVLDRLPPTLQSFLMETAFLNRFCAALCQAVTEQIEIQRTLDEIERNNLFLVRLDDNRTWYRYHHLFADVLQNRLRQTQPEHLTVLHLRASRWYEEQKSADAAIHHALAAKDFQRAANVMEQFDITIFAHPTYQSVLDSWLAALPEEVISLHPRLSIMQAWSLFEQTEVQTALQALDKAETALTHLAATQPQAQQTIGGEIMATRALLTAYSQMPDFAHVIVLGQVALANVGADKPTLRTIAASAIAMAYLKQGSLQEAEQMLNEAMTMGQAAGNVYVMLGATSNLINVQRMRGALRPAIATCHAALKWVTTAGGQKYPVVGGLLMTLADLLREINELELALHYAQEGVTRLGQWGPPYLVLISHLVLLRVKQAYGDWEAVWTLWRAITEQSRQLPYWQTTFQPTVEAHLHSRQGDLTLALPWATASSWQEQRVKPIYSSQEMIYDYEYSRIVRAQILLTQARSTGDRSALREILAHLARQRQAAEAEQLPWLRIKVHLLQALAYNELGEKQPTLAELTHALTLAEPAGYLRVFVDEGEAMRFLIDDYRLMITDARLATYVDKVRVAFGNEPLIQGEPQLVNPKLVVEGSKSQNLIEPLSERELEILQLVNAGLSNREIAEKIIVTVGTVKKHLNNIFGKLGVGSRTQVLVLARQLKLL